MKPKFDLSCSFPFGIDFHTCDFILDFFLLPSLCFFFKSFYHSFNYVVLYLCRYQIIFSLLLMLRVGRLSDHLSVLKWSRWIFSATSPPPWRPVCSLWSSRVSLRFFWALSQFFALGGVMCRASLSLQMQNDHQCTPSGPGSPHPLTVPPPGLWLSLDSVLLGCCLPSSPTAHRQAVRPLGADSSEHTWKQVWGPQGKPTRWGGVFLALFWASYPVSH